MSGAVVGAIIAAPGLLVREGLEGGVSLRRRPACPRRYSVKVAVPISADGGLPLRARLAVLCGAAATRFHVAPPCGERITNACGCYLYIIAYLKFKVNIHQK